MFHAARARGYDAALCMYHDQALIPIKTLAFDDGVNVTLGLPFVRTSPDHGTAFDIAGKGIARPDSLIAALQLAARLARHARPQPMSPIDDLPPLREVIARARPRGQEVARPELPARPQPDAAIARAAGPLEGVDRRRGRPRTRRADPRAARRRARASVIAIERDARCLPALAEIAAHYPGRLDGGRRPTRSSVDPRAAGSATGRSASSPTCPTTSAPRCSTGWLDGRGLAALVASR